MAKFEAVFYVYFMTVDGQVHSTAIANAANYFKVTPPTDYEPNGKVVTGWTANDAVFTADTVVTADTYVYPVTEDCYWVTFNTTGGSMVASRSVIKGDTLDLRGVTAPKRTGYRFKGWSTTADGALISSVTPTADTTLYAVWEGDNVSFTGARIPTTLPPRISRLTRFSVPNPRPPKSARPSPVPPARQATIQLKTISHITAVTAQ